MKKLTHVDNDGLPGMVDVSHKSLTERIATASGRIIIPTSIMDELGSKNFETSKGSIIQTAIIAGTMAVKNTYQLIPFCHQIPISSCKINIEANRNGMNIRCTVKTIGQTGVEMEALQGTTAACLTIYDMCKALSHDMEIGDIHLIHKSGGKTNYEK